MEAVLVGAASRQQGNQGVRLVVTNLCWTSNELSSIVLYQKMLLIHKFSSSNSTRISRKKRLKKCPKVKGLENLPYMFYEYGRFLASEKENQQHLPPLSLVVYGCMSENPSKTRPPTSCPVDLVYAACWSHQYIRALPSSPFVTFTVTVNAPARRLIADIVANSVPL